MLLFARDIGELPHFNPDLDANEQAVFKELRGLLASVDGEIMGKRVKLI